MKPLDKLAVFILSETKNYTDNEIADFMGITREEVKLYSAPSPYRFGSYFRKREIKMLKTLVEDERTNVKVAISLTDDVVRLGHLTKVLKELKKLGSKLTYDIMAFNLKDLTVTDHDFELKH